MRLSIHEESASYTGNSKTIPHCSEVGCVPGTDF